MTSVRKDFIYSCGAKIVCFLEPVPRKVKLDIIIIIKEMSDVIYSKHETPVLMRKMQSAEIFDSPSPTVNTTVSVPKTYNNNTQNRGGVSE